MIRSFAFAAALVAAPVVAHAADYEIDPSHSSASFTVKHLMVSNVRGEFRTVKGTASWSRPDHGDAKVEVTIDAASIDTRDAKRDAHLKSADFFDVQKFPTLTFKSKRVQKAKEPGHLTLIGDLTIHGVTKEVAFDVTGPTPEMKAPWGQIRVGAEARARIDRKDFGLTWNKALETGGVLVGNDVDIDFAVELVKKPPMKAAR